ncbi:MAG: HD domain-containing protein [Candidatus Atribacteria bacterium]|nr:MAG: HD domain-containing protein [Candidatus Atribacteria bacterium]
MDLNQEPENEELKNLKTNMITALTIGYIMLLIFLIAFLVSKYFFKIPIYNELFFLFSGCFLYLYLVQYILKKRRMKPKLIKRIHFANYIAALLFVTGIFHYTGGILWIGCIFFIIIILYSSILSTPREGLIIALFGFTCYSSIVLLEYFDIIPYVGFFKLTPYLYKDSQYVIITTLLIGLTFFLIFFTGKNFTQKLRQRSAELAQAKKELEEWGSKLEEKVGLRTRELKKSKDQLSVLYQIFRSISSTLKLDDILQTILDFSIKISGAGRGSIMLLDKKKRIFFIKIPYDKSEKNIDKITFAENENTIGWVVKNKKFLYIEDLESDKHFSKIKIIRRRIKQLLIIPIIVEDKVIGVINLENTSLSPDTIDLLMSFSEGAAVSINNAHLYKKIKDSYFEIVKALAQAIEAKDPYTHGHSERVMKYSLAIAPRFGLSKEEKESLRFAAILHDIGKIGVRGIILDNPDGLTNEEYDEIKKHTLIGENIIQPVELLQSIRPLIKYHHEWYNGKGYPDGLSGENIPLGARILAVSDAYDAMESDRPYRKALTEETAIQELKRGSGSQFDPKIVEIFLEILKQNSSGDGPSIN